MFRDQLVEKRERLLGSATDNQISDIIKSETLESEETVASTSHNLTQFVDCGETIKEEIKEEVQEEYQRDPLRLSNAVQSLDEPVTVEEFFVEPCDIPFREQPRHPW